MFVDFCPHFPTTNRTPPARAQLSSALAQFLALTPPTAPKQLPEELQKNRLRARLLALALLGGASEARSERHQLLFLLRELLRIEVSPVRPSWPSCPG